MRVTLIIGSFLAVVWYCWHSSSPGEAAPSATHEQSQAKVAQVTAPTSPQPHLDNPWGPSPFSSALPNPPNPEKFIKERQERMKKGGYSTPSYYFTMNLKQLEKLAKDGDRYAILQLGEQYWEDVELIQWDPDFKSNESSRTIATRYFERAILEGQFDIAAVLAQKAVEDQDLIEGQAWQIVFQRISEKSNMKYPDQRPINLSLTGKQATEADNRAKQIITRLDLPFM